MNENRLFWGCLGISLVVHTGFFVVMGYTSKADFVQQEPASLEVSYVSVPDYRAILSKTDSEEGKYKTGEDSSANVMAQEAAASLSVLREEPVDSPVPAMEEGPAFEIPTGLDQDMDYQKYYKLVRDQIRLSAEENYKGFKSSGIVHVAFILSRQGTLKSMQIFKEDSTENLLLKQVAIRSVKSATPLPQFPKELSHDQLPFSIYIEFKSQWVKRRSP